MTLFSRKIIQSKKNVKFLGAHLPLEIIAYLELYALAKQVSKTTVVKEQMAIWKESQEISLDKESLLHDIAYKAYQSWKATKPKKNISIFCSMVTKELNKRNIKQEDIKVIIQNLLDEAKK